MTRNPNDSSYLAFVVIKHAQEDYTNDSTHDSIQSDDLDERLQKDQASRCYLQIHIQKTNCPK